MQHRVAADGVAVNGKWERGNLAAGGWPHFLAELDEVQLFVDHHRAKCAFDNAACAERVVGNAEHCAFRKRLHKQALPCGAADVGRTIHLPIAIDLLLEKSASRKRKGLYPVERGTAGLHEQARVFVARCVIDTHRDTTNRIDNGFETLEIDFDIVMNGNVQRALHSAH